MLISGVIKAQKWVRFCYIWHLREGVKPSPITESNEIGKPSDECDVGLSR